MVDRKKGKMNGEKNPYWLFFEIVEQRIRDRKALDLKEEEKVEINQNRELQKALSTQNTKIE